MIQKPNDMAPDRAGEGEFVALLRQRGTERTRILAAVAAELAAFETADAVATIKRWRDDARLHSLMSIAAALEDEALDQLPFAAEELQREAAPAKPESASNWR